MGSPVLGLGPHFNSQSARKCLSPAHEKHSMFWTFSAVAVEAWMWMLTNQSNSFGLQCSICFSLPLKKMRSNYGTVKVIQWFKKDLYNPIYSSKVTLYNGKIAFKSYGLAISDQAKWSIVSWRNHNRCDLMGGFNILKNSRMQATIIMRHNELNRETVISWWTFCQYINRD